MTDAFNIHYHGSDTVGSVLERLERASKQLQEAVVELSEQLHEAKALATDAAQDAIAARELAEEGRDLAGER